MIFKVIAREGLSRLFDLLVPAGTVVGPVEIAVDRQGRPRHGFSEVADFSELALDYGVTALSAKGYVLPYRERLASFRLAGQDWEGELEPAPERPLILFGLHACDINALNKLDKVLLGGAYPVSSYAARRGRMFVVGVDCRPRPSCFCRSMGADTARHGFDLFVTDLGDDYFVEILSSAAFNLILKIDAREPAAADHHCYRQRVAERNAGFTTQVDTTDLTKILDLEFQAEVWQQWGARCLSCGTCANVCPTCYCYTVSEQAGLDLQSAHKTKMLYSCNFVDFAAVAGGHNFRPTSHARLKYRYYHKHRGFVEAYEEPLCVGCGRCGESCLAGITVPEVIASVRGGAR